MSGINGNKISRNLSDVLDRRVERRLQRRQFFRNAGGLGLGLVGGTLISACGGGSGSSASAASAPTDPEILNFALESRNTSNPQFYTYATSGSRAAREHDHAASARWAR